MATKPNTGRVIIWMAAFGIAVLAFLYLRGCGKGKDVAPVVKIDTVTIVKDSIIYRDSISYVPKPYKVEVPVDRPVPGETQYIPVDTNAILKDYLSTRYYEDTLYQNDSFGVVISKDTVSRNSIIGRGKVIELRSLAFHHIVTKTEVLPRRITGYYGVTAGGNASNIFTTGGVTLGLMNKQGRYFGLSANLLLNSKPFYGVQFMAPIHLKK